MPSVLIINDHQGTLDTQSTILRLAGFDAATASTGRAGIDRGLGRAFDVHLIDLRLPDMSGIDVVREFKLNLLTGRAVIVTVFPAFESAFDAAAAGADGYVDGMLFGDEVVEVVAQALTGPFPVRHPSQRRAPESPAASDLAAAPHPRIDWHIREVMRLIDADLAASPSVADLAARVEWSASSLTHQFHTSVGVSIKEYRRERRLQETARRLVTTGQAVRQIAYGVGYRSLSLADFRRDFRKRFEMSPKAYRTRFWRGPARRDD
jgi:AraC-like DNA-binding protein/CheY-like chemotaxis protein